MRHIALDVMMVLRFLTTTFLAPTDPIAYSFLHQAAPMNSRAISHNTDPRPGSHMIEMKVSYNNEQEKVSSTRIIPYLAANHHHPSRRCAVQLAVLFAGTSALPRKARAAGNSKSRSEGYEIQKSDDEWHSLLTTGQFDVLRNGGTERPYSSILEAEDRLGTYHCAGCGTPLFVSSAKFHSGTGWPSFASALPGVEIEKVNILQSKLGGAELRCKSCGGHLGDVFQDGFMFVGTPAAQTGRRFCIDGAALIFKSSEDGTEVVGDQIPDRVEFFFQ